MSKQKSYTEVTQDHINKAAEQFGWQSKITENYINAHLAVNLALITDYLIEIYGSERRKEIDKEMK